MRANERASARQQLDKRLNRLRNAETFERPQRGWIKAIRNALGMTLTQLGRRMGVTQPTAQGFEQGEVGKSITLETLERAANALDCRLVYAFVPRKPLAELVGDRARALARKRLSAVSHSMALEGQGVRDVDERAHLEALVEKIANGPGSALWEDE